MVMLGPQFGLNFDPPTVDTTTTKPPREWSYRQGHEKDGQGYLFRARTSWEKFGDQNREQERRNRAHAERRGYIESTHRSTMGLDGRIADASPAQYWPKPDAQVQHGEYTVAHFPDLQGIAAFKGDQPVARLQMPRIAGSYYDRRRVVGFVETSDEHRRRGIATAMWHLGQQVTGGNLVHDVARTPLGNQWAKAMGGKTMLGQDIADDHTWDR